MKIGHQSLGARVRINTYVGRRLMGNNEDLCRFVGNKVWTKM